jgi:hypothetical protein
MIRTHFGRFGGHVPLFDLHEAWAEEKDRLIEAYGEDAVHQEFVRQAGSDPAMKALVEAGIDTKADFASFLWGFISTSFYRGYERVESMWDRYVGVESVNTFDEVRIKGINGLTGIGYVGDYGEYQPLRRTFRPEAAIVVDTYGGVYGMTRKLLRSAGADRLVERNPNDIGEAMSDFIARMIVALIVANPNAPDGAAMYNNTRGNQQAAALSEATFVDAAVWLRTQKDDDLRPIRVNMRTAVVQNDRQALILNRIVRSAQTGATINDPASQSFPMGTDNPIAQANLLPPDGVVIDPYFPDANDVYFFADTDRNPAFVAAFLDGQRRPMIGMAEHTVMHLSISGGNGRDMYSYEGDTIDYKTRHDVGVSAIEPRGTYRLTPA